MANRIKGLIVLAGGALALSGCVTYPYDYAVNTGPEAKPYYPDEYVGDQYAYWDDGCDPDDPQYDYYACDLDSGYADIGFAGGTYQNYVYPGYGLFLFDNFGQRYPFTVDQRRYWGDRRRAHRRERLQNLSPNERAAFRARRAERRGDNVNRGANRGENRGGNRGGNAVRDQRGDRFVSQPNGQFDTPRRDQRRAAPARPSGIVGNVVERIPPPVSPAPGQGNNNQGARGRRGNAPDAAVGTGSGTFGARNRDGNRDANRGANRGGNRGNVDNGRNRNGRNGNGNGNGGRRQAPTAQPSFQPAPPVQPVQRAAPTRAPRNAPAAAPVQRAAPAPAPQPAPPVTRTPRPEGPRVSERSRNRDVVPE